MEGESTHSALNLDFQEAVIAAAKNPMRIVFIDNTSAHIQVAVNRILEERSRVANLIINTTKHEDHETAVEMFKKINEDIKQVLGLV